jgi:hypothetical protein
VSPLVKTLRAVHQPSALTPGILSPRYLKCLQYLHGAIPTIPTTALIG